MPVRTARGAEKREMPSGSLASPPPMTERRIAHLGYQLCIRMAHGRGAMCRASANRAFHISNNATPFVK